MLSKVVTIIDNKNAVTRLTITSDNKVRIKVQSGLSDEEYSNTVCRMSDVADYVISNGFNTSTLRGTYKTYYECMTLETSLKNKDNRKRYKVLVNGKSKVSLCSS